MQTHFFNLVLYAVVFAALFSLFMRAGVQPRIKFAAGMVAAMVLGSVVFAWLMNLIG